MTILVQQQLREATERLIAEGENCWPATLERFTALANPAAVLALLDELDQLKAENAKLIGVVHAYEAARDSLFVQCLSNPIKNAWGKQVDVSLLNQAHEQAGKVIACQRSREQAMTKEQP